MVRPDNGYSGQVALVPPTGVSQYIYSKSFGVVVFLEDQEQRGWSYIVKDSSSFNYNVADTACRAMGFTHVVRNSVMTAEQYGEHYSFGAGL